MSLKTKNKILHKIFNDSVVKNRVPFTVLLDGKEGYGVKVTLVFDCDHSKMWGSNRCENYRKIILEDIDNNGKDTIISLSKMVFPDESLSLNFKYTK